VPDAKGKLPACVIQSLLWWEQSLAKLGLDSSAYIEGGIKTASIPIRTF
jgi:hypothetical protein